MVTTTDRTRPKMGSQERRNSFIPEYEPFQDEEAVELDDDEVDGAVWFMNPTRATFDIDTQRSRDGRTNGHAASSHSDNQRPGQSNSDVQYKWTSRDNRKGRHPLQVSEGSSTNVGGGPSATSFRGIAQGIYRMATCLSSDISYLGALAMTVACVFLVTNAILSFLPYADPTFQPPEWISVLEGVLTFVGCSLFLTSSSLGFIEAVNQNRRGCFGWKEQPAADVESSGAVENEDTTLVPDWSKICRRNSIVNLFRNDNEKNDANGETTPLVRKPHSGQSGEAWTVLPTMDELRNHFIYDLGFIACSILLMSSALYCASAAAALVTIVQLGSIARWIRIPQFIASLGFMGSSALFMLETQEHWLRPQFSAIGWWISFLNLVGSAGFAMSALFPMCSDPPWAEYQLSTNFFWGSWGFFIGSMLQWYESLDKHPVSRSDDDNQR